jgi:outer membrane protein OmpA-like peptidoglycan-associated protein
MIKTLSGIMKAVLTTLLISIGLFLAQSVLHAEPAFPELDCERLLDLLADNGWRIELSESGEIFLMPPGQKKEDATGKQSHGKPILFYDSPRSENKLLDFNTLKSRLENNGWRVEKSQDGAIYLYFDSYQSGAEKPSNGQNESSNTYTFNQLDELGKKLAETGWNVEQRQGNLYLFPKINPGLSAPSEAAEAENRFAITAPPLTPLVKQASDAGEAASVVPSAQSTPEITQDSDNDSVVDEMDLCPKTKTDIAVNPLGCEKSKALILDGVRFKSSSAALMVQAEKILDQYAEVLKRHQSQAFKILGHTDSTGSKRLNLKLSGQRARSVRDYFVTRGIDKSRIDAKGRGEKEPIASNKTKKGRLKNRRVELIF